MEKYIGVKMVDAKPMTRGEYNILRGWELPADENGDDAGFLKDDGKGHIQWDPKDVFDKQNVLVVGDNNKVHPEDVENMISKVEVCTITPPGTKSKTTLVQCVLVNGFVITESSDCVDPANYSEKISADICMEKIKNQIWFLMGFLMQSAVYGFQQGEAEPVQEPAEDLPVEDDVCAGGPDCKTFGQAIEAMKNGFKVARKGWNGKGMFAYLVPANSYPAQTGVAKSHFGEGAMVPYREYLALKTAQGDVATWAPSGSDALAEDWQLVE